MAPRPIRHAGRQPAASTTLVEVLVVVGILAVLVGLLVPAVQKVRASAATVKCHNQLRQVSLASQAFHTQHQCLPPHAGAGVMLYQAPGRPMSPKPPPSPSGRPQHPQGSLLFHVLPFLDQEPLWGQADAKDELDATARLISSPAPFYRCPARGGPLVADVPANHTMGPADIGGYPVKHGLGDYAGNGLIYLPERAKREKYYPTLLGVTDGTSNTVFVAEMARGRWVEPRSAWSGYTQPWASSYDNVLRLPDKADAVALCRDSEYTAWITDVNVAPEPGPEPGSVRIPGPPVMSEATMTFGAGSPHPGGVPVAACDGSVRTVRFHVSAKLWSALLTPDGGDGGAFPD